MRLDERAAHVVVADEAGIERDARLLGVTERRGQAGIGHRDHHVGVGPAPRGPVTTERLAGEVDVVPETLAVGAGKVDELEHAMLGRPGGKWKVGLHAVLRDSHQLARLHVAHVRLPQ